MKTLRFALCAVMVMALSSCAGEDGANGDDGTNGTDGADGAVGVSSYEIVLAPCTALPAAPAHGYQTPVCPTGKKILGGGVAAFSDAACTSPSGEANITYSGILIGVTPPTWVGDMVLSGVTGAYMQTQVICANVD